MKLIYNLEQLPKYCGWIIMLLYGVLFAEFCSTFNDKYYVAHNISEVSNIIDVFMKISYFVIIFSTIVIWFVSTFLFHIVALLLNGEGKYNLLLITSAYSYIIPVISFIAAIILLDSIELSAQMDFLNDSKVKILKYLINGAYVPYYITLTVTIKYIYKISYLKSILVILIPIVSIWLITELFKLI
jgi:hypothetical protein